MKLGEAILERDGLERRLELLESRVASYAKTTLGANPLLDEIKRTANSVRDLDIAIAWTEHQASLSGLPLAAYRTRITSLKRLAKTMEIALDHQGADDCWQTAHHDHKVIQAAVWLVDLQIPPVPTEDEPEAKEGED